jgi:hypothetical protein
MPQYQARLARGGPAVLALHDPDLGPANAHGNGFYEDRAATHVRLGDVFQACGLRLVRFYGDGLHLEFSRCGYFAALAPFTRILIA